jgi:hypothetical protein
MSAVGSAAYLQAIARSAAYEPPVDYRRAPLGSLEGEEGLAVPYNASHEAVVHVRNWSALIARKVLVEAISPSRGGARAVADKSSPYFGKSVEELHRLAKDEQTDMSWYKKAVKPLVFGLRFDGVQYLITPELEEVDIKDPATGEYKREKQPKWHLIPAGAWDLYMGNYARMRSPDFMERTKEMEQLQNRGLQRFVMSADNEAGFLEFKYEEIRYEPIKVDREKIAAGDIIEV